jgi:hypothetical protein
MTNNQTIIVFIVLIFYLIGLGFLFNAIGKDITISVDSEGKEIPTGLTETTFIGNIVTGINDCPIWLNTIFIAIPVALLILAGILLIVHG